MKLPAIARFLGIEISANGMPFAHINRDSNGNPRYKISLTDLMTWTGRSEYHCRLILVSHGWRWIKASYNIDNDLDYMRKRIIEKSRELNITDSYGNNHKIVSKGGFSACLYNDGGMRNPCWRGKYITNEARKELVINLLKKELKNEH